MIDLNITIVNYFLCEPLLSCLASIRQDITNSTRDITITVVDNSQNRDAMRDRLQYEFPSVQYIDAGGNIGFSKANNIGLQLTKARFYLILNPDTVIPQGTRVIDRMIDFLEAHAKVGAVAPRLVSPDGSLQRSIYRFDTGAILIKPLKQLGLARYSQAIRKRIARLQLSNFAQDRTQPVDWALGAALLVRREVVETIGWLDEDFFMYMEDCDWCRRMWEAHWPVYFLHDVVIEHAHGRGSASVPGVVRALAHNKLARIHVKSWLRYLWKWRGVPYYGKVN